ncbi:ganglioside GM2 activator-like [Haliotis rufescens]|uniref:ganglioside GM2 activator-like n=1 Tax=Haliotis rufescens TaxID=6454 RepID=UPI00201F91DC|nr:ganglioside GM2 activator-like [Haliotis rufescens]XP_046345809.2 ganglioside GM2 activator-like [Haliotis rufescens]
MYANMAAAGILALLCLTAGASSFRVLNFKSYDRNAKDSFDIMNILMRRRTPERYMPQSYFQKYGISLSSRLTSFSYKNCGDPSTETARLLELQLSPDPIQLPGVIQVAFKVVNLQRAVSPIQTEVTLWKKVIGMWIRVPCWHNVGSCSYGDFCGFLDQTPCPKAFHDNNIPCKCPFPMGNYTLPTTEFDVNIPNVPSGDFCIKVNLKIDSSTLTCYEVYFSIA